MYLMHAFILFKYADVMLIELMSLSIIKCSTVYYFCVLRKHMRRNMHKHVSMMCMVSFGCERKLVC